MVSIIIPVYNEEEIILANTRQLIEFLDHLDIDYEIIICSNGSTDSTNEKGAALEAEFPGKVRFYSIPERGVGLAFEKAVEESRFNHLISIDMDLTTDLSFIPETLKLLNENDIVIGSKKVGDQNRSLPRLFISSAFILLVKKLLDLEYSDYSIGSKAYKKDVISRWSHKIDHGSSYVIELIYHAVKEGYTVNEIPVFCDDTRKSKFNLSKEIVYRFKNLLKLWLSG